MYPPLRPEEQVYGGEEEDGDTGTHPIIITARNKLERWRPETFAHWPIIIFKFHGWLGGAGTRVISWAWRGTRVIISWGARDTCHQIWVRCGHIDWDKCNAIQLPTHCCHLVMFCWARILAALVWGPGGGCMWCRHPDTYSHYNNPAPARGHTDIDLRQSWPSAPSPPHHWAAAGGGGGEWRSLITYLQYLHLPYLLSMSTHQLSVGRLFSALHFMQITFLLY